MLSDSKGDPGLEWSCPRWDPGLVWSGPRQDPGLEWSFLRQDPGLELRFLKQDLGLVWRRDPGYMWSRPCKPRMGIEWFGVGQTTLLARYWFSNSVFLMDVENEA